MKRSATAGVVLLILYILVPVGSMIVESFYTEDFFRILANSRKEIVYSFAVSGCVAVITVVFSALFAYSWYRERKSTIMLFILSVPFLIPSAILGLSLILFWNRTGTAFIYQSAFMPVIGLAVRFGILPILFLTIRMQRIDKDLMEAIRVYYSFLRGFFAVLLPMIWKDLLTCFLLIFALAMGEYGIVLLITPPGYQMLTIKIYNYLHYGASEVVFSLNLFVFTLISVLGILIFQLYKPKKEKL